MCVDKTVKGNTENEGNESKGQSVAPKCGGNCDQCPFQQKIVQETSTVLGGVNSKIPLSLITDNGGKKSL